MKHRRFLLLLSLLLPAAVLAQTATPAPRLTPLPGQVRTLVFDGCTACILPDTVSGYEDGEMNNGSGIRVSGNEMTFSHHDRTVRLHLRPADISRIVATGNSEVTLQGTFRFPGTLELAADDAATITAKSSFDTLYADRMAILLEDAARLYAHSHLQMRSYDISVRDYSRLKAFILEHTGTVEERQQSHLTNSDYASFHIAHTLFPGHNVAPDTEELENFWSGNDESVNLSDLAEFDTDALSDLNRWVRRNSKRVWRTHIDFAWGFHNWGSDPFAGLAGMEGDAAVRTSFNHILLTLNFPVVTSRRMALFAGLGLEWDKYKFHSGEVLFDATADPHRLTLGSVDAESRLLTRHFIVPISLCFNLGRQWKLDLAAIPGLHWSGSHTGLRRDYTEGDNESQVKDYTVNRHLNPFKLDARIAVRYRGIGLYFQAAMLPAFKSSCEDLYPVKFGIIF